MVGIERALLIAAEAHEGRLDKQGEPYILHPLRVMHRVSDPDARIVAVLHDVVEDSDVTLDELREEGFSERVLEAVRLVTHAPSDTYAEYVIACKADPIARSVKLADLQDNTSLDRALLREGRHTSDLKRHQKYVLSYQYLTDKIDEAEYRRRMIGVED